MTSPPSLFPDAQQWLVDTLRQLVRIPSVNPMGGAIDPTICFEQRLTEHLCGLLDQWGLPLERQTLEPGRDNILTRVEGAAAAPVVLLEVHQDTVPITGMTIDPFGGTLDQNRVYGRGA